MKKRLINYWQKISRTQKLLLLFAFFVLLIFVLNSFHEEYPDEFDSILGGLYITQGKIPYKDWFQHHQPFAYVLASVILPFVGRSFVKFRFVLGLIFFAINFGGYFLLKRRLKKFQPDFYLGVVLVTAIAGTYFWGQMLLADTLAAYLLLPAYTLLFLKAFFREKLESRDFFIITLLTFFSWLTSMTYLYVIVGVNLFALYLFLKEDYRRRLFKALLIVGSPYFLFLIFLVMTGSLKDYYFSNIVYNQNYYIYNYPRPPGAPVNPVRYATVIVRDFFNNFLPILVGVKDFALAAPFNVTLALSNAVIFVYLIIKRRFALLLPFLVMLIFANSRSNPLTLKETDYQASVYILSSFMHGLLALVLLKRDLDENRLKLSGRIVAGFLLLLLGVYWFFNSFYLSLKFYQKFHEKYMGMAPLIYNNPEVSVYINEIVSKDDYVWIGPFEFEELFYLKAKVPSKYHWFLQHAAASEKIKTEMLADFARNRPKIIVFNKRFSPWGGNPAEFNYFFTDWLFREYAKLSDISDHTVGFKYRWVLGKSQHFDFQEDFYIDRNRQEEVLSRLLEKGYIEKVTTPN